MPCYLLGQKNINWNTFNGLKNNSCFKISATSDNELVFGNDAGFFKIQNRKVTYLKLNQHFKSQFAIDAAFISKDTAAYTVWKDGTYIFVKDSLIKKIPHFGSEMHITEKHLIIKGGYKIYVIERKNYTLEKVLYLFKTTDNQVKVFAKDNNYDLATNLIQLNRYDAAISQSDYTLKVGPDKKTLHLFNFCFFNQYVQINIDDHDIISHPLSHQKVNDLCFHDDSFSVTDGKKIITYDYNYKLKSQIQLLPKDSEEYIQQFQCKDDFFILGTSHSPRGLTFEKVYTFQCSNSQLTPIFIHQDQIPFRHLYVCESNHLWLTSVDNGLFLNQHLFFPHSKYDYRLRGTEDFRKAKDILYFSNGQGAYAIDLKDENLKFNPVAKGNYKTLSLINKNEIYLLDVFHHSGLEKLKKVKELSNQYLLIRPINDQERLSISLKPYALEIADKNYKKKKITAPHIPTHYIKKHLDIKDSILLVSDHIITILDKSSATIKQSIIVDSTKTFHNITQYQNQIILSTSNGLFQFLKDSLKKMVLNPLIDDQNINYFEVLHPKLSVGYTDENLFLIKNNELHLYNFQDLGINNLIKNISYINNTILLFGSFGIIKIPEKLILSNSNNRFLIPHLEEQYDYQTPIKISLKNINSIQVSPTIFRYKLKANENWSYIKSKEFNLTLPILNNLDIEIEHLALNKQWLPLVKHQIEAIIPWHLKPINIVIISLVLLIIIIYLSYAQLKRVQKSKLKLENILNEKEKLNQRLENIRLQIAADFHDNLGNDLASIIVNTEVLQDPDFPKEKKIALSKKLNKNAQNIYNGAKDFIWSLQLNHNNTDEVFSLLSDFGNELFEICPIQFSTENHLTQNHELNPEYIQDLILIIKELLTNAYKHSHAQKVSLQFTEIEQHLVFIVSDNGIGIKDENTRGMGLENIKERQNKIKAQFNYNRTKTESIFTLKVPAYEE